MARFNFSVRVYPFQSQSKARAFASVVIEDVLEIKNFKVIEGSRGLFVSPPQTKSTKTDDKGNPQWFADVLFHEADQRDPDNGVFKGPVEQEICDAIIAKYQEVVSQNSRGNAASAHNNRPQGSGSRPGDNPMMSGPQRW